METSEAIRIVQALANGIDPLTGEVLPDASLYNDPSVLRALFRSLRALELLSEREKRERSLPRNAGKPWSEGEDQSLVEAFARGVPVEEIAAEHCRTAGAIVSRLVKRGRLSKR